MCFHVLMYKNSYKRQLWSIQSEGIQVVNEKYVFYFRKQFIYTNQNIKIKFIYKPPLTQFRWWNLFHWIKNDLNFLVLIYYQKANRIKKQNQQMIIEEAKNSFFDNSYNSQLSKFEQLYMRNKLILSYNQIIPKLIELYINPNPVATICDGTIFGIYGHITAKQIPKKSPLRILPIKGNIKHGESNSGKIQNIINVSN
ncbi:unnamed protein product [Paramecium sonneborni]|uniref:Uncharacterized protein n=1 Tax=Paramecium sonneborni TaxID=65129 RepID=A0A8S1NFJ0_9CILI|nr:unnamed protein product [Paramecium sonneborni]